MRSRNRHSCSVIHSTLNGRNPKNDDISFYFLKEDEKTQKLEDVIQESHFSRIIYVDSFMSNNKKSSKKDVKRARRLLDGKSFLLVAGGSHASARPREVLEWGFDLAGIGEGERVFPKIVSRFLSGENWKDVPGTAYLEEGKLKVNQAGQRVDLNEFPPFSRELRPTIRSSVNFESIYTPIEIIRGCPWGCKFCQTTYLWGKNRRFRSIPNVVKYAKFLAKEEREIRFIAPNCLAYGSRRKDEPNLDKLEELLKELSTLDAEIHLGNFPSEIRPNFVNKSSLNLIREYCANDKISLGAQSGSDRILKKVSRGHTSNNVLEAVEMAVSMNFEPIVDFIADLPGERKEDIEKTRKNMKKVAKLGGIIHLQPFKPLPGTPYANKEKGQIPDQLKSLIEKLQEEDKAIL